VSHYLECDVLGRRVAAGGGQLLEGGSAGHLLGHIQRHPAAAWSSARYVRGGGRGGLIKIKNKLLNLCRFYSYSIRNISFNNYF
jgi:hypothetical protein